MTVGTNLTLSDPGYEIPSQARGRSAPPLPPTDINEGVIFDPELENTLYNTYNIGLPCKKNDPNYQN